LAEAVLLFLWMLAANREKLRSSMFSIVVMVLILESLFWVLRKRAPFCNRGDASVFVENSGVFGSCANVNACIDKDKRNPGKKVFSLMIH